MVGSGGSGRAVHVTRLNVRNIPDVVSDSLPSRAGQPAGRAANLAGPSGTKRSTAPRWLVTTDFRHQSWGQRCPIHLSRYMLSQKGGPRKRHPNERGWLTPRSPELQLRGPCEATGPHKAVLPFCVWTCIFWVICVT